MIVFSAFCASFQQTMEPKSGFWKPPHLKLVSEMKTALETVSSNFAVWLTLGRDKI